MLNISNGKVPIVEGVPHKARHALSVDGVFNCVEELEVHLLEHILEELSINEIVHAFKYSDSKHVTCALCLIPQLGAVSALCRA